MDTLDYHCSIDLLDTVAHKKQLHAKGIIVCMQKQHVSYAVQEHAKICRTETDHMEMHIQYVVLQKLKLCQFGRNERVQCQIYPGLLLCLLMQQVSGSPTSFTRKEPC